MGAWPASPSARSAWRSPLLLPAGAGAEGARQQGRPSSGAGLRWQAGPYSPVTISLIFSMLAEL